MVLLRTRFPAVVVGFDGLDGVFKRLFQLALTDGPDHEAEQLSLDVLTVAYHDDVDVGVAKELRAAWTEVSEPGDVLLGRQSGCLMKAQRGHACSLSRESSRPARQTRAPYPALGKETHYFGSSAPACSATMYAAYQ